MTCPSPQIPPSDDASTPRHNGLGLGEGYGMKGGGNEKGPSRTRPVSARTKGSAHNLADEVKDPARE